MRKLLMAAAMVGCAGTFSAAPAATIGAGSDTNQPSTTTNYSIPFSPSGLSVSLAEDVAHSDASGPWHKVFTNDTGSGIGSGDDVTLQEVLTNAGSDSWIGWNEKIFSRTTVDGGDAVGFLFRQGTLSLAADYGSGFVNLFQGVDYTLTTVAYSGPPDNNPGPGNEEGWEEITISLIPSRYIEAGDRLRVTKNLFEVFGDADPWRNGDPAEITQYPLVPEPAGAALAIGALGLLAGRRRRQV